MHNTSFIVLSLHFRQSGPLFALGPSASRPEKVEACSKSQSPDQVWEVRNNGSLGYNGHRHRHRRFKRIEAAGTIRTAGFRLPRVLTGVVPL